MASAGDETAAAAERHARLRASAADREQVIEGSVVGGRGRCPPLADVNALRVCVDDPSFVGDGAHHVLAQPGSVRTEGAVSVRARLVDLGVAGPVLPARPRRLYPAGYKPPPHRLP